MLAPPGSVDGGESGPLAMVAALESIASAGARARISPPPPFVTVKETLKVSPGKAPGGADSVADTAAGFHYAYSLDPSALAGATYANSAGSSSWKYTFGGAGTYTVYARIIDQDCYNLPKVHAGLKAKTEPFIWYSSYQEGKIRNFHENYDRWMGITEA